MSLMVFSWPLIHSSSIVIAEPFVAETGPLSSVSKVPKILPSSGKKINFSSTLLSSVIGVLQVKLTKDRVARGKKK